MGVTEAQSARDVDAADPCGSQPCRPVRKAGHRLHAFVKQGKVREVGGLRQSMQQRRAAHWSQLVLEDKACANARPLAGAEADG
jgi:hypothetical protein